jgi:flavin-binding protein dodecin
MSGGGVTLLRSSITSNGERRRQMATLKVIEVLTDSSKSWEDAAQEAIREAGKTVENIRSIYIKDFQAVVENNKITKYRINAKISFEIRK